MAVRKRSLEELSEPRVCAICDEEAYPARAEKDGWLRVVGPTRYDPNRPASRHFCSWGCLAEYADLVAG